MTVAQAIRILDSATTQEALLEINTYQRLAACEEARRIAVKIMRKYQEEHSDID